jgi:hypothetical protein
MVILFWNYRTERTFPRRTRKYLARKNEIKTVVHNTWDSNRVEFRVHHTAKWFLKLSPGDRKGQIGVGVAETHFVLYNLISPISQEQIGGRNSHCAPKRRLHVSRTQTRCRSTLRSTVLHRPLVTLMRPQLVASEGSPPVFRTGMTISFSRHLAPSSLSFWVV